MGKGGEFGGIPDSIFRDLRDRVLKGLQDPKDPYDKDTAIGLLSSMATAEHSAANPQRDPNIVDLTVFSWDIQTRLDVLNGSPSAVDRAAAIQKITDDFDKLTDAWGGSKPAAYPPKPHP